jgi:predicted chitinase
MSLRKLLRGAPLAAGFLAIFGFAAGCSPDVGTGARPTGNTGAAGPGSGGANNTVGGGVGMGGSGVGAGAAVVGGADSVAGSVGTGGVVGGGGLSSNAGAGGGPKVLGPGNRCELAGVTVAKGTTLLVDDVEDDDFKVLPADGRDASWFESHDTTAGAVMSFKVEPTTPGAPGSTKAIHYHVTGLDDWGAVVGLPFNLCYDASAYVGFSFWIKGAQATGGTDQVLLALHTPISEPEVSGGACKDLPNCYNHFSADVFTVPTVWTRYTFTWSQFKQGVGWGIQAPAGYVPQKQILAVSLSPVYPGTSPAMIKGKSFDLWIDQVSFDLSGDLTGGVGSLLTEQQFNGMFSGQRNGLYTSAYANLVDAAKDPRFALFAREGATDDQKREIAAFLANVGQESGDLAYSDEIQANCASPGCVYCKASGDYPCAGGQQYFGRGPLQLTWNDNYGSFSDFLGIGKNVLLSTPAKVSQDGALAWKAALWYWMEPSNAHKAFLNGGFGDTIKQINGALECGGKNPGAVSNRQQRFRNFCAALGVAPGAKDTGC